MNRFAALLFASLLGVSMMAQPSRAGLILDLAPGGISSNCMICGSPTGTTYGWIFHVSKSIAIDGIGLWDEGSDGIGDPVQAGLWTSTGVLLASATITNASDPAASANASGQWLFEDIATLILGIGDYLVGSLFQDAGPPAHFFNAPVITDPDISVLGGVHNNTGAGFGAPFNFFDPIYGPTLRTVPEPGSFAMILLGLGLLGFLSNRGKQD